MAMNSLLFVSYLKEKYSMSHIKTVFRTLFYQYFLVFIWFSLGFYFNAEWIGFKGQILYRSFNNIFFPIQYNESSLSDIKKIGSFKLWNFYNRPNDFFIIEDAVLDEEWYYAKFTYTDYNNKKQTEIDSVRIRWKPWEYYYLDGAMTEEELLIYRNSNTLNSQESDKAFNLMHEKKMKQNQKKNNHIIIN